MQFHALKTQVHINSLYSVPKLLIKPKRDNKTQNITNT